MDSATAPLVAEAMGAEGDLVAARLGRGCRCFGAWIGDELAGYGWVSAGPEWIGELELEITPGSGAAYIWNCVTLPPHRRKGVFSALVASVVARARKEGLGRMWIGTLANLADNAMVRAGFVAVVRFDTATRLGFRRLTVLPIEGIHPGVAVAARAAIGIKPGSSVRRSQKRRH